MDQTSKISMGDQTIDQKMKMNMGMEMSVAAVPDSKNKEIETLYKRIAMNMETMGMNMAYDSDDPATASGPLAAMGGIVGKPFTIVVDENSRIVEVKGVDQRIGGVVEIPQPGHG